MSDYSPSSVDFVAERCETCGEVALRKTALGERPIVDVRWRATKSATCDHMVLDYLRVSGG
jgi:hypothetical protein